MFPCLLRYLSKKWSPSHSHRLITKPKTSPHQITLHFHRHHVRDTNTTSAGHVAKILLNFTLLQTKLSLENIILFHLPPLQKPVNWTTRQRTVREQK
ncbi:hypothetical protein POPTR_005G182850v4 [Populus trichocarpa]|nr:hypothetical protein BDE02_05G152500 [Populus trichocarpa]KAI9395088.1 hypothetical protein POPTR_005G182850v4 [Populus trichocarpa]